MLISYGMSLVGSSHISKNVPCQDSHRYQTLSNGWVAAAVADGVGSARHSEVASQLACDTFIATCAERITEETSISEAKNIIAEAYRNADQKIKDHVRKIDGELITDYDTTLSAVVYDGKRLAYGHSGDGGIVVLTYGGDYIKVTAPQKAEDGICVIPLRAGERHWEFGECEVDAASVLLATDGVYDNFMPYLLRGQPVEFYIPLIRWFMDNNIIGISAQNRQEVEDSRKKFLCGDSCKSITDDKTVLVVFNADVMPKLKEDSFYAEPDWTRLQEIWNRKAYPHLYKDKPGNASEKKDAAAEASDQHETELQSDDKEESDRQETAADHAPEAEAQSDFPFKPAGKETKNKRKTGILKVFNGRKK